MSSVLVQSHPCHAPVGDEGMGVGVRGWGVRGCIISYIHQTGMLQTDKKGA